jgi:hypothetical protein
VESALAKRLAREPGLRHAQQRRPEQSLNLGRRSNVEALFAQIAGTQAPHPCKNCHKGHGPWTSCVVVEGQMCGSCANCWFNASGSRCSFHGKDDELRQTMCLFPCQKTKMFQQMRARNLQVVCNTTILWPSTPCLNLATSLLSATRCLSIYLTQTWCRGPQPQPRPPLSWLLWA